MCPSVVIVLILAVCTFCRSERFCLLFAMIQGGKASCRFHVSEMLLFVLVPFLHIVKICHFDSAAQCFWQIVCLWLKAF